MRILGADSFSGSNTSIGYIPVSEIKDKDVCILKFNDIVYFYQYDDDSLLTDVIPDVIKPTETPAVSGGRWILGDTSFNKVFANEVKTNLINPKVEGADIPINDSSFTISPTGSYSNGTITIQTDGVVPLLEPPLVVNSSTVVRNFNAEFLDGIPCHRFVIKENYKSPISKRATEQVFGIPNPPLNDDYTLYLSMVNTVDDNPSIYTYIVTEKFRGQFTVKFSSMIESSNYEMHYLIIGEFIECGDPPSPETWYLLTNDREYITDVDENKITVTE